MGLVRCRVRSKKDLQHLSLELSDELVFNQAYLSQSDAEVPHRQLLAYQGLPPPGGGGPPGAGNPQGSGGAQHTSPPGLPVRLPVKNPEVRLVEMMRITDQEEEMAKAVIAYQVMSPAWQGATWSSWLSA